MVSGRDFTFQCRGVGSVTGQAADIPCASLPKKTKHKTEAVL